MSAPKLLAIVVGSLLLFGGVAAVSAAGPGEMSADNAQINDTAADRPDAAENADAREESAADGAPERPEAAENQSNDDRSVGPAGGLPDQVPDHVSQIHDAIESFLDGTIADLGDALQNILADDADDADNGEPTDEEAADEQDSEETADDEDDDSASADNAPADVPA